MLTAVFDIGNISFDSELVANIKLALHFDEKLN